MNTTFKDIKEIRKGYHKMPDGTIMKNSDHPKEEEELEERVRASDATRAKLAKPLDRQTKKAWEVKIKNMIDDLDNIAWQLENQVEVGNDSVRDHLVKEIDKRIKEINGLQRAFKIILR
jgi:hypothetical protein